MINPQWLELPMSRMNFHGPKDIRAIEVRLYVSQFIGGFIVCIALNKKGYQVNTFLFLYKSMLWVLDRGAWF